ncbi:MAG: hypothetical protein ACOZDY_04260 [Pseudomonadota bacterium]
MTGGRAALMAAFVAAVVVGLMLAIAAAVRWWQGAPLTRLDWIALAALPLLVWTWWRYVSPFSARARCLLPTQRGGAAPPGNEEQQ